MYVTLEPCAHQGRQPPCTEAILEAGIGRVVIASDDPSEKASGRGPGVLRDGGVEVEFAAGEEASSARLLNQSFRKHARTGLPLVTLKMAISIDGRFARPPATRSGSRTRGVAPSSTAGAPSTTRSRWASAPSSPTTHCLRLATRVSRRQPTRVVFDRGARTPLDSQLLRTLDQSPVIVVASPEADTADLRAAGAEVILAEDIRSALVNLGGRGVTSLFLEGGPTLAAAFAEAGEIDEARTFVAPLLLGGAERMPALDGSGDTLVSARFREW